jgi:hypothetical protein
MVKLILQDKREAIQWQFNSLLYYHHVFQCDNTLRKLMDLEGNNNLLSFNWHRIEYIYEALDIHDPATTIHVTGGHQFQKVLLDSIVNDVYRQTTFIQWI